MDHGSERRLVDYLGSSVLRVASDGSILRTVAPCDAPEAASWTPHAAAQPVPPTPMSAIPNADVGWTRLGAEGGTPNWRAAETASQLSEGTLFSATGGGASSKHVSVHKVPVALRNLGVSSSYNPSAAAAAMRTQKAVDLNQSSQSLTSFLAGDETNCQSPTTVHNQLPHHQLHRRKVNDSCAPAATGDSVESRAQVFYHRLQAAAKRELEVGQIKSPTRDGVVVNREAAVLQFARVGLKEPAVATQRLKKVQSHLFDEMIANADPVTTALQQKNKSFTSLTASHVSMFSSGASPAAVLSQNSSGLSSPHVNVAEYNPYFPVNPRLQPPPSHGQVHEPLLVAVPNAAIAATHGLFIDVTSHEQTVRSSTFSSAPLLSPRKGEVGTLAISSPLSLRVPPFAAAQQKLGTHGHSIEDARLQRHTPNAGVHYASGVSSALLPSHCQQQLLFDERRSDDGSEAAGALTRVLSEDEKAIILHACQFLVERPIGPGGLFFTHAHQFQKCIGVSPVVAQRLVATMMQRFSEWDQLDKTSVEWVTIRRILELLLATPQWTVPASLRLPSGAGGTSKWKVSQALEAIS